MTNDHTLSVRCRHCKAVSVSAAQHAHAKVASRISALLDSLALYVDGRVEVTGSTVHTSERPSHSCRRTPVPALQRIESRDSLMFSSVANDTIRARRHRLVSHTAAPN